MSRPFPPLVLAAALAVACAGPQPAPRSAEPQPKSSAPTPAAPRTDSSAGPGNTPAKTDTGAPAMVRLQNGVTVFAHPSRGETTAVLQIGFLAGTDFGLPGTAELAAACLVDSADAVGGRPSLRQAIANLGGTVDVDVQPMTTWITVLVPQNRWLDAARRIGESLAAPPASRSQIERIRDEYVLLRIQQVWNERDREVARAFQFGFGGPAGYVGALLDRDPSEVHLFAMRAYRPDLTTFVLRAPVAPERLVERLADGIAKWPAATQAHTPLPLQSRRLAEGLYWSTNAAPLSRVLVLLPLPELNLPGSPDAFLLHSCVTLDGVGGRLEQLQQRRGLGHITWTREFLPLVDAPALVLAADVIPADVPRLWSVLQDARRSLRDLPPTASEFELGLRRAPLLAELMQRTLPEQLRNRTMLTMQGLAGTFARRMQMLREPTGVDLTTSIDRYLARPAAMIVLGGTPPPGEGAAARPFDLLPAGAYARLASPDPVAQAEIAFPWIDKAVETAGGSTLLARVSGFAYTGALHAESAPQTDETLDCDLGPPRIERRRELLGQTITTSVDGSGGTETLGTTKASLTANAAGLLQREIARHPALLLAACARGDLRFRPVAQRTVGDRDLMILEAVGGPFDRLRLHVDTVSQLVRVVEVWETTSEGAFVHLSEAWSDYRSVAGLRVPFRRIAEIDDGKNRVETVFTSFEPKFAAPAARPSPGAGGR